MKSTLSCLALLVLAVFGHAATNPASTPAPLTAKELAQGYREHVILARPRATQRPTVDRDEAREGVRVRETFSRFGDLRVIDLDDTDSADAAIARLRATGRYDFVEPDYLRYLQAAPNDPRYSDGTQWALNNIGPAAPGGSVIGVTGADIKAAAAWDIIHDAPNVVVAVVDTGVKLTHQDISGNLWTNPSPSSKGDLHGANFVGGRGNMVGGDPTDDDGHGTHVAGIIGAAANNSVAIAGIAWKVQLMAVKVFPPNASGSVSEIAAGVNYAITHGANIINASYGALGNTGYSQTELTAITAARNAGVIFVAAAGNDTANMDITRSYPASHALDNIVTVGASNRRDEIATAYSNYGAAVDLFAPGDEIMSLNYASNTGAVMMSGTSMAAPHVSGALALLKAEFPNDNYRQLINRLLRGVDRGAAFNGKAQTDGRLNILRSLQTASDPDGNRPFNDKFSDRPHFSADNLAIRSSNAGANAELGEPGIGGNPPAASLWWEWTAPASGVVSLDTNGSGYDTLLAVYTGNSVAALTLVAANDNDGSSLTSRLTFPAQAGVTYEICVDGKGGATGLTLLNLGTTPANDAFASPVTLTGDSLHLTGTNAHCSREPGEPTILGFSGGTSLWYTWTASHSGRFQVSAVSQDFDPILAVYTGNSLTSLTPVYASDNTGPNNAQTGALCNIDAVAGTTYRITVDAKSASTIGQFTLGLVDSVWQATTGGAVTGAPAVASDGTVYVGSTDHSLYAFAPDGAQKWAYATGGSIDTCSPAIADDGTVYVGSNDGKLYAVAPDGSLKWSHAFTTSSGTAAPAGASPAIGADGTLYARTADGFLHALNPADGTDRWPAVPVGTATASFYGNPVVGPDGTIYQGSDETDHTLYAISRDGTVKWRFSTQSGLYGAPAIGPDGDLYLGDLTGRVYRVSSAGAEKWHQDSGGNISSSIALSADGTTLYYGGYDHALYARDTANGNVRWTYALDDEVRSSSPALDANGAVYIGCYDGKLYAVNADGSLKRTYDAGNWLRSPPAIASAPPGGSGTAKGRLYVGSNDQKLYAFDLAADAGGGPWPQYRANARRLGRAANDALAIAVQPQSQTAILGQPLTLSVIVTGQGPITYQWNKDGVALPGATGTSYTVATVSNAAAGSYTVTLTNPKGTLTSSAAAVSVAAPVPGRLTNVSVRTTAGTADQKLIVSFVVSGSGSKSLLVRGIGPSLAPYGVTDALTSPQLQLLTYPGGASVASNSKWGGSTTLSSAFASVGAFALLSTSNDDALIASVPAGGYSANITGANNTTGTALAEVYDLDSVATPSARIINVSARAQVGTGGNILIAGFAISGNVPKQILIRGIGPGLFNYGVGGYLADPKLEVYDASNHLVASNDNWGTGSATLDTFASVGAFGISTTSRDSAVLVKLQPGTYTAQVSGVNNTTGVALIEVYEVP